MKPGAVDMSAAAVTARLQQVSDLADLRPERRLDGKIDMSAHGVTVRVNDVSELRDLCLALEKGGAVARARRPRST
jgi:hypothetical protein